MNKLDLATNIVLVNYCMCKTSCSKCEFGKDNCNIFRYVSRVSKFHNNNKIIALAKDFCNSKNGCSECEYYISIPDLCCTNVLSVKYFLMKYYKHLQ